METNEMKQKNEEILARWRSLGLLDGLKRGSINEWRCAKSFDDIAHFLLETDRYANNFGMEVVIFPFIRKVLCTGKKRLYRLIRPEEIFEFFKTTTPNDCIEYLNSLPVKQRKRRKMTYILLANFLNYNGIGKQSLEGFFKNMYAEEEPYQMYRAIFKDVVDLEAEVLAIACDLFVEENTLKSLVDDVKKEKKVNNTI